MSVCHPGQFGLAWIMGVCDIKQWRFLDRTMVEKVLGSDERIINELDKRV